LFAPIDCKRKLRTPLTLLELLASLETAVAAQRGAGASAPVPSPILALRNQSSTDLPGTLPNENAITLPPGLLQAQMEKAGLTNGEFSAIFGVSPSLLGDWLGGQTPVPTWVLPTIQMLYLLSPAVRRRLLQDHPTPESVTSSQSAPKQIRSHPFSRIEDL
jgi:hypothetical protein